MTKGQNKAEIIDVKALLGRHWCRRFGAEKGERSPGRLAYRSG